MGTTFQFRTRSTRDVTRRVLIPLLVALALMASQLPIVGALSADAAIGPWVIDGVVPDGTATMQTFADVCNGTDDKPINGAAYKLNAIQDAGTPVFDTGNVTGKSDLCTVWLDLATDGDDVLLYFAWQRFAAQGAVNVSLELQKGALTPSCQGSPDFFNAGGCNPFANRQAGDLLVTFDFDPVPTIYVRTWSGSDWGPAVALNSNQAEAAIDGAKNSTLRGESAINLTAAGILPAAGVDCVTFATVLPFSQTGNSTTAELQDIVLNGFPGPSITNCGQLVVEKATSPAGLEGPFPVVLKKGETTLASFELTQHGSTFTYGDSADEDLFAGADYSLTETVPTGWDPDYTVTCTIGGSNAIDGDGKITVEATKTTSCLITNTAIAPEITLVKVVDNQYGGTAAAADFQARLDGSDVDWDTPITTTVGSHTASELMNVSGYEASDWGGDCAPDGTITLGPGENATCTITNSDIQPTLTLEKTVDNSAGGTATKDDFQASIDGTDVDWDAAVGLDAGAHTASETTLPGYLASAWGGDCAADGSVNLLVGDSKTCTVTNTAIAPTLTVVKEVVNNSGGTAEVGDFPLFIGDDPVLSGDSNQLVAGVEYTVSEEQQEGYAQTGLVCVDDDTEAEVGHPVTLALAQSVTCTITNDDVMPGLTVVKSVTNDDGGLLGPDDFQLRVNGGPIAHGVALADPQAGVAYEVTEDDPSDLGYAEVGTVCVDAGTQDQVANPVTLALGQAVVCTITNDDIAPTVTVTKEVINDDGGTAEVGDFTLLLGDDEVVSGVTNDATAGVEYTVSEELVDGYEQVSLECTDASEAELGGTFTPALGQDIDCVIVNDDIAPTVTVTKTVINDDGGTAEVGDFTLLLGDDEVVSGVTNDVTAGVEYTVSEELVDGYEQVAFICTDGEQTDVGATFTPELGQNISCVFVNDDIAPTITVTKEVINDDGGTAEVGDFTLLLGDDEVVSGVTNDATAGVEYTVSEELVDGYEQVSLECTDASEAELGGTFTPALGQDIDCVIVNDDLPSGVSLVKEAVLDADDEGIKAIEVVAGEPATVTYRFLVTNTGETTLTDLTLVDDKIGPVTLEVDTLAPGESTEAFADYTLTEADISAGRVDNIGTVTGTDVFGNDHDDEDDETVFVIEVLAGQPGLDLVKTALLDRDEHGVKSVTVRDGEDTVVTYRYVITNTGSTRIDDLSLLDDKLGDIALPATSLEPGASITVDADYTLTAADIASGQVTNVGVVTGTDENGVDVSADDDEQVDIVEVLDVVLRKPAAKTLPKTGADGEFLVAIGILLAALGAATLLFTPRRRRRTA